MILISGALKSDSKPPPPPPMFTYRDKYKVKKKSSAASGGTTESSNQEEIKETSDIVRSLLSRSSIFDQDIKRLNTFHEKYEPSKGLPYDGSSPRRAQMTSGYRVETLGYPQSQPIPGSVEGYRHPPVSAPPYSGVRRDPLGINPPAKPLYQTQSFPQYGSRGSASPRASGHPPFGKSTSVEQMRPNYSSASSPRGQGQGYTTESKSPLVHSDSSGSLKIEPAGVMPARMSPGVSPRSSSTGMSPASDIPAVKKEATPEVYAVKDLSQNAAVGGSVGCIPKLEPSRQTSESQSIFNKRSHSAEGCTVVSDNKYYKKPDESKQELSSKTGEPEVKRPKTSSSSMSSVSKEKPNDNPKVASHSSHKESKKSKTSHVSRSPDKKLFVPDVIKATEKKEKPQELKNPEKRNDEKSADATHERNKKDGHEKEKQKEKDLKHLKEKKDQKDNKEKKETKVKHDKDKDKKDKTDRERADKESSAADKKVEDSHKMDRKDDKEKSKGKHQDHKHQESKKHSHKEKSENLESRSGKPKDGDSKSKESSSKSRESDSKSKNSKSESKSTDKHKEKSKDKTDKSHSKTSSYSSTNSEKQKHNEKSESKEKSSKDHSSSSKRTSEKKNEKKESEPSKSKQKSKDSKDNHEKNKTSQEKVSKPKSAEKKKEKIDKPKTESKTSELKDTVYDDDWALPYLSMYDRIKRKSSKEETKQKEEKKETLQKTLSQLQKSHRRKSKTGFSDDSDLFSDEEELPSVSKKKETTPKTTKKQRVIETSSSDDESSKSDGIEQITKRPAKSTSRSPYNRLWGSSSSDSSDDDDDDDDDYPTLNTKTVKKKKNIFSSDSDAYYNIGRKHGVKSATKEKKSLKDKKPVKKEKLKSSYDLNDIFQDGTSSESEVDRPVKKAEKKTVKRKEKSKEKKTQEKDKKEDKKPILHIATDFISTDSSDFDSDPAPPQPPPSLVKPKKDSIKVEKTKEKSKEKVTEKDKKTKMPDFDKKPGKKESALKDKVPAKEKESKKPKAAAKAKSQDTKVESSQTGRKDGERTDDKKTSKPDYNDWPEWQDKREKPKPAERKKKKKEEKPTEDHSSKAKSFENNKEPPISPFDEIAKTDDQPNWSLKSFQLPPPSKTEEKPTEKQPTKVASKLNVESKATEKVKSSSIEQNKSCKTKERPLVKQKSVFLESSDEEPNICFDPISSDDGNKELKIIEPSSPVSKTVESEIKSEMEQEEQSQPPSSPKGEGADPILMQLENELKQQVSDMEAQKQSSETESPVVEKKPEVSKKKKDKSTKEKKVNMAKPSQSDSGKESLKPAVSESVGKKLNMENKDIPRDVHVSGSEVKSEVLKNELNIQKEMKSKAESTPRKVETDLKPEEERVNQTVEKRKETPSENKGDRVRPFNYGKSDEKKKSPRSENISERHKPLIAETVCPKPDLAKSFVSGSMLQMEQSFISGKRTEEQDKYSVSTYRPEIEKPIKIGNKPDFEKSQMPAALPEKARIFPHEKLGRGFKTKPPVERSLKGTSKFDLSRTSVLGKKADSSKKTSIPVLSQASKEKVNQPKYKNTAYDTFDWIDEPDSPKLMSGLNRIYSDKPRYRSLQANIENCGNNDLDKKGLHWRPQSNFEKVHRPYDSKQTVKSDTPLSIQKNEGRPGDLIAMQMRRDIHDIGSKASRQIIDRSSNYATEQRKDIFIPSEKEKKKKAEKEDERTPEEIMAEQLEIATQSITLPSPPKILSEKQVVPVPEPVITIPDEEPKESPPSQDQVEECRAAADRLMEMMGGNADTTTTPPDKSDSSAWPGSLEMRTGDETTSALAGLEQAIVPENNQQQPAPVEQKPDLMTVHETIAKQSSTIVNEPATVSKENVRTSSVDEAIEAVLAGGNDASINQTAETVKITEQMTTDIISTPIVESLMEKAEKIDAEPPPSPPPLPPPPDQPTMEIRKDTEPEPDKQKTDVDVPKIKKKGKKSKGKKKDKGEKVAVPAPEVKPDERRVPSLVLAIPRNQIPLTMDEDLDNLYDDNDVSADEETLMIDESVDEKEAAESGLNESELVIDESVKPPQTRRAKRRRKCKNDVEQPEEDKTTDADADNSPSAPVLRVRGRSSDASPRNSKAPDTPDSGEKYSSRGRKIIPKEQREDEVTGVVRKGRCGSQGLIKEPEPEVRGRTRRSALSQQEPEAESRLRARNKRGRASHEGEQELETKDAQDVNSDLANKTEKEPEDANQKGGRTLRRRSQRRLAKDEKEEKNENAEEQSVSEADSSLKTDDGANDSATGDTSTDTIDSIVTTPGRGAKRGRGRPRGTPNRRGADGLGRDGVHSPRGKSDTGSSPKGDISSPVVKLEKLAIGTWRSQEGSSESGKSKKDLYDWVDEDEETPIPEFTPKRSRKRKTPEAAAPGKEVVSEKGEDQALPEPKKPKFIDEKEKSLEPIKQATKEPVKQATEIPKPAPVPEIKPIERKSSELSLSTMHLPAKLAYKQESHEAAQRQQQLRLQQQQQALQQQQQQQQHTLPAAQPLSVVTDIPVAVESHTSPASATSTDSLSNIDRIIDEVSKGNFDREEASDYEFYDNHPKKRQARARTISKDRPPISAATSSAPVTPAEIQSHPITGPASSWGPMISQHGVIQASSGAAVTTASMAKADHSLQHHQPGVIDATRSLPDKMSRNVHQAMLQGTGMHKFTQRYLLEK